MKNIEIFDRLFSEMIKRGELLYDPYGGGHVLSILPLIIPESEWKKEYNYNWVQEWEPVNEWFIEHRVDIEFIKKLGDIHAKIADVYGLSKEGLEIWKTEMLKIKEDLE